MAALVRQIFIFEVKRKAMRLVLKLVSKFFSPLQIPKELS